ncbi:hypothetical protein GYA13_02125 [Candidatus Kuenenbacteria bacterium]|nr:hypothetical protein [Candidatus Kuenenbacteria bacterium]
MDKIRVIEKNGVTVLILTGAVAEGQTAIARLDSFVQGLLAGGENIKVVVDLSGAYHLTYIARGLLLFCALSLRERGRGNLKLAEVSGTLRTELGDMINLIGTYPTVDEAIVAFASPSSPTTPATKSA